MFLAHVNSLQASIFSSLAIVSLLLTFVMLGSHWLRNYVYAFAAAVVADCSPFRLRGLFRRLSGTLRDRDSYRALPGLGSAISTDADHCEAERKTRTTRRASAKLEPGPRGFPGDVCLRDCQSYEHAILVVGACRCAGAHHHALNEVSRLSHARCTRRGSKPNPGLAGFGKWHLSRIADSRPRHASADRNRDSCSICSSLSRVLACWFAFLVVHTGTTSSRQLNRLVG